MTALGDDATVPKILLTSDVNRVGRRVKIFACALCGAILFTALRAALFTKKPSQLLAPHRSRTPALQPQ